MRSAAAAAGLVLGLSSLAAAFVAPDQQLFRDLEQQGDSRQPHGHGHGHGQEHGHGHGHGHDFHAAWLNDFTDGLDTALDALHSSWEESRECAEEVGEAVLAAGRAVDDALTSGLLPTLNLGAAALDPDNVHPPHKTDKTIYELVSESKYSTKFAKLLNKNEALRDLLNSTDANVTVFVPTDQAFDHLPDVDDDKIPEAFIEAAIKYHILPEVFPAGKIFGVHTLPTLLDGDGLSGEADKTPQRVSVKLGLGGLYINAYNRVIYPDVFTSNGVIHAVKNINIPPPSVSRIVSLAPTAFSTFELGLVKTGLGKIGKKPHLGSTLFVPSNGAWNSLGFRANAFLFSRYGRKYLRALLAYHIVANQTLYSDAYYGGSTSAGDEATAIPKGRFHLDLPTLLKNKTVSVDVGRFGRFIDVHVNHYSKVVFQDALGYDGVLHVLDKVLIPPREHHKHELDAAEYDGGEITVEELKMRLDPFVEADECPLAQAAGKHGKHGKHSKHGNAKKHRGFADRLKFWRTVEL